MKLFLIRHGRSVANEANLVTGTTDDPLSDIGIGQAESLRAWIETIELSADTYITSQWKRAQDTAKIVFPYVKWQIDPRIGETYAGDVAKWALIDFLNEYPDFYHNYFNDYPNGESHNDLYVRSIQWLKEIVSLHDENATIVLVAHSGPISCILQHILSVPMENFPAFLPMNASLSMVEIPNKMIKDAKLKLFSSGPDTLYAQYFAQKAKND